MNIFIHQQASPYNLVFSIYFNVYDAVISDRPYRDGWIEEKAIKLITDEAGKYFDPKVVDAFLTII